MVAKIKHFLSVVLSLLLVANMFSPVIPVAFAKGRGKLANSVVSITPADQQTKVAPNTPIEITLNADKHVLHTLGIDKNEDSKKHKKEHKERKDRLGVLITDGQNDFLASENDGTADVVYDEDTNTVKITVQHPNLTRYTSYNVYLLCKDSLNKYRASLNSDKHARAFEKMLEKEQDEHLFNYSFQTGSAIGEASQWNLTQNKEGKILTTEGLTVTATAQDDYGNPAVNGKFVFVNATDVNGQPLEGITAIPTEAQLQDGKAEIIVTSDRTQKAVLNFQTVGDYPEDTKNFSLNAEFVKPVPERSRVLIDKQENTDGTITINGSVQLNGSPVADVGVPLEVTGGTLTDSLPITDSNGNFTTTVIPNGEEKVSVSVDSSVCPNVTTIVLGEPASISLSVSADKIPVGKQVTVTAVVKDGIGQPVKDVTVHFETNLGTITPQDVTTDQNGTATAILTSSQAGTVTITATAENLTSQKEVIFSVTDEPQPLRQPAPGEIPIYTVEELCKIGKDSKYPLDGKYILMANLDLAGTNYVAIGSISTPFKGTFDGNGLVIKNLKQAMFDRVDSTARLQNIKLENVNIYDEASLVRVNYGVVSNCSATGVVRGGLYYGYYGTGGLIGENRQGGIVTNSYFSGTVYGESRVGGLVGRNAGEIKCSYSTGSVIGKYDNIGGLVGENHYQGRIIECYSTSDVEGRYSVGGLVGYHDGELVQWSYATGNVKGEYNVGGFVGYNSHYIAVCYSIGKVTGLNPYWTGGFAGNGDSSWSYNCYWNIETSGQTKSFIGIGKTTAEMKKKATYINWSFSEYGIWRIDEDQSYPYLKNNEQIPHPGTN